MIESKEQLLDGFREKARAFVESPGLMSGIDLDDAAVTLKRYALSELHDQELASLLGRLPKLLRSLDVTAVVGLLEQIETHLAD
ncbi:MAG: hypothetical protein H6953_13255 [Chromatiaceae bacterium]|nr:hypothetical protein [Gammaproteobacteria bacterium]MCP5306403.1 hypothetical protein [Chromatiaceae bacterium]MCP5311955.1 hypothetical protein [Chromatiaceae bacterium]